LPSLKSLSVCFCSAVYARESGGQGLGIGVVSVGATELAHLALTGRLARQRGAGFRSSRSGPREALECRGAGEGALREPLLGKRDAFPAPFAHVSSAEQASAAHLGL
jgi:hypothetical protein